MEAAFRRAIKESLSREPRGRAYWAKEALRSSKGKLSFVKWDLSRYSQIKRPQIAPKPLTQHEV